MALTLKKSLGQHFLHDQQMCRKTIEQLHHHPGMQLVEIGPGGGALTRYLSEWTGIHYKLIEVDSEKVDFLKKEYPALSSHIIQEDILKAAAPFEGQFSVIGNLPYNISSPILFRILEWQPQVTEMVAMFQKEVAQRIAQKEGSRLYGILSVLMQTFFKVEYLFEVHERCFVPPPKVKSAVIRFHNLGNPHKIEHMRKYQMLVKAAFNQRRKTLRNALKSILPPEALTDPLMDRRAEHLSVDEFVFLHKQYQV